MKAHSGDVRHILITDKEGKIVPVELLEPGTIVIHRKDGEIEAFLSWNNDKLQIETFPQEKPES